MASNRDSGLMPGQQQGFRVQAWPAAGIQGFKLTSSAARMHPVWQGAGCGPVVKTLGGARRYSRYSRVKHGPLLGVWGPLGKQQV